jgi:TRAP transporter TAXI family solute receptor
MSRLRIGSALLLVALSLSCTRPSAAPARHTIRIGTGGGQRGNFYPVGLALARVYATAMPDVDTEVKETGGGISNLDALENGSADVGFSFADVAYAAYVGRLGDQPHSFTRLRALALLQLSPVQLVVSDRSPVHDVLDLRGRKVTIGGAGSGSAETAELVLGAYGINPKSSRVNPHSMAESIADLAAGRLDAMFVLARYPVDAVTRALQQGSHLMPLAGDPIEQLHRDYPFFRPMLIPAGVYPGQSLPVRTLGVHSMLLCRADLDEALVYRLTKALFQAVAEQPTELLQSIDLDRAAATPIPLHAGAARYYRERELFP